MFQGCSLYLSSEPNQLGQKFRYSRTDSDMQTNVAKQIL